MSHHSFKRVPATVYRLRAVYLAAISMPVLLGATIARHHTGRFDVGLFALSLVGALMLQGGTTMTNDAFDLRYHGQDDVPLLPVQVLQGALAFFVVGIMVGIYIALLTGPLVLLFGAVGIGSALAYSVPPVRLAGTGVGEVVAGFNLSVITTLGSYYVQTQQVAAETIAVALPCAFLVAGVLAVNGFKPARLVEARPLWRRLGTEGAFKAYLVCVVLAFGWLAWAAGRLAVPATVHLAWGALPLAGTALGAARQGHLDKATRHGAYAYLAMMGLLVLAYAL